MTEADERARVVREVRKWRGTPYHHEARIIGTGVDCAQLLLEAFIGAGLVGRIDVGHYTSDWMLHRSEERYLATVESHLRRVDADEAPLAARPSDFSVAPGDVLVWRIGRTYSHGAIVADWPFIVHAYLPSQMVEEERLHRIRDLCRRPMRVYSFWGDR